MGAFTGIPPEAPAFLAELAANNETAWFNDHKEAYRELIQTPLRHLLAALAPAMLAIDPGFDTNPMGAAVSRIRRDVRFSRDKSPYRIKQWISFKRPGEGWQDRPCFFLGFTPGGYRYGMGYYAASPATMGAIRTAMAARPHVFAEAMIDAVEAGFALLGDSYRRLRLPKAAAEIPECLVPWFGLKSGFVCRERPLEPLFHSPALADEAAAGLRRLAPLYHLLSAQSVRTDRP